MALAPLDACTAGQEITITIGEKSPGMTFEGIGALSAFVSHAPRPESRP